MKSVKSIFAIAFVWSVDLVVMGLLLVELVVGIKGYNDNIRKLEKEVEPFELSRYGENVLRLGEGDAVLYYRMDGWMCSPRAPGLSSRFVSGRLLAAAGLKAGGNLFVIADSRCRSDLLADSLKDALRYPANVYLVGHDGKREAYMVCEPWTGSLETMSHCGEAIDLASVRLALYGDPYYVFPHIYKPAVDLVNGDFHLNDQVVLY